MTLLPNDVGGRYSVLSPVGMIPAVFDGMKIEKLREGARAAIRDRDLSARLIAQTALSFEREEWITLFWFYESTGRTVGAWLQQLWAESLAKKDDRQGKPAMRASSPLIALGAVDQHSLLQQVMDGAHDKFVIFVRAENAESGGPNLMASDFADGKPLVGQSLGRLLRAEVLATEQALHQSGVSTLTITTEGLDEAGLGEFLMTMQLVVAGMGEFMGLNPFDQPGVELGKRLAHEILKKA
jgi:glucose-6-phosphate isomerase